ncbi:lytic transglycosylase [Beijerinckiaceae bacterium]|nr:lytic transglycosylase [Beijerinckiaceae bacterium]
MMRISLSAIALSLACTVGFAQPAARPAIYDALIAQQAKAHGLPESFVHRIVLRESRYNPRLVHNHCFGLMQIKHATAREMGFKGPASGLLDPQTNLSYAVPYLANAYRLADGDENRATALFSSGYYYLAKRKKMLASLRTASTAPVLAETAPPAESKPEPQANPIAGLFSLLTGTPAEAAPDRRASPIAQ